MAAHAVTYIHIFHQCAIRVNSTSCKCSETIHIRPRLQVVQNLNAKLLKRTVYKQLGPIRSLYPAILALIVTSINELCFRTGLIKCKCVCMCACLYVCPCVCKTHQKCCERILMLSRKHAYEVGRNGLTFAKQKRKCSLVHKTITT